MKKIISTLAFIILIISSLNAQSYIKVRFINVESDKNIRQNTAHNLCVSCSDESFIVDGDESLGTIELNFSGVTATGPAKAIYLIMNAANVEYAESGEGFKVYYNNQEVGNINRVYRNAVLQIKLDAAKIKNQNTLRLILKTTSKDGSYLASKKTGFGAVLKLEY